MYMYMYIYNNNNNKGEITKNESSANHLTRHPPCCSSPPGDCKHR